MEGKSDLYTFGPFTLDRRAYRLQRGALPVSLSPKLIDLLLFLVERPSALVTKEDLVRALWPDVAVTDNALSQAVSELRQALGDDPAKPTYIQTIARRGYRFVCRVTPVQPTPDGVGRPSTKPAPAEVRVAPDSSIAVVSFENMTRGEDVAWLMTGIAETVTNDLRGLQAFRVIERARVMEASRQGDGSLAAIGRGVGADLVVVGSYQVAADHLRITARIVDVRTGETVAHAKGDGVLAEVFSLQDGIVTQFAEQLGVSPPAGSVGRSRARETTSLEAYRAFTEGRLRLEALDGDLVPPAILDFERAIELDPGYALAYVGLANAQLWSYEMSRARNRPDADSLARGIDFARRAIELDRDQAEPHATLSFLLVRAGRSEEALAEARRAAALEPGYWPNQFRLGYAAWGEERLRALSRAIDLYPEFAFAHFGIAMVHIARSALESAEQVLRQGVVVQDRQAGRRQRFPGQGLHWLLGLTRLARGDVNEAVIEFERELAFGGSQLYSAEFAMDSYDGCGFALLRKGEAASAAAMFRRALELYADHARSRFGLARALRSQGLQAEATAELARAAGAVDDLRSGGRESEAAIATAFDHVLHDRLEEATTALARLAAQAPPGFVGWTIPIEPLFEPLHRLPSFQEVLATLSRRAR